MDLLNELKRQYDATLPLARLCQPEVAENYISLTARIIARLEAAEALAVAAKKLPLGCTVAYVGESDGKTCHTEHVYHEGWMCPECSLRSALATWESAND